MIFVSHLGKHRIALVYQYNYCVINIKKRSDLEKLIAIYLYSFIFTIWQLPRLALCGVVISIRLSIITQLASGKVMGVANIRTALFQGQNAKYIFIVHVLSNGRTFDVDKD